MKREINCPKCANEWVKAHSEYPGEYIMLVPGRSRGDYLCDGCNKELPKGSGIVCVSLYTDEIPYYPWEDGFLEHEKSKTTLNE